MRRHELGSQTAVNVELGDLYLALRCAAHDPEALARLEARCIEPLGGVIGRVDPSPDFIDDIKQRVRTKLLVAEGERPARIRSYAGRGPIDAWVRIVAIREATSEKRRSQPWSDSDSGSLDVEASLTSPELGLVKEQYRVEFEQAFSAAMAGLSPEQRNLLRHHYLHGLSFDQIGGIYSLHRSSVARRIDKARKTLLAETRRGLAARLATNRDEFDRLFALIASRIDLSIERHLG
nr:sigma-70 family RNA polymerase sigma factor [Pseudenhygromyxa sp. WMMC2535]